MFWGVNTRATASAASQFKLNTGRYCYPLTVQDAYSRYLLASEGPALPK